MKLVHVSDTHSLFPKLPEGDVIVHTGDLCPNATRGKREIEVPFQAGWVRGNITRFKEWIGARPFLFVQGNHDFTPNVCDILVENGIDAHDISNKKLTVGGLTYYGFPFVPYIAGEWNWEVHGDQMQREIRRLRDILEENPVDILCCHAPIYGILDMYYTHCGNLHMADLFNYGLAREKWPKVYLHGHIHEANGETTLDEMRISNAATTVHLIPIGEEQEG